MAALAIYGTTGRKVWDHGFRAICALILFFLMFPIPIIIPLSFNAEDCFIFTEGVPAFESEACWLKHYTDFFINPDWQQAMKNSFLSAPAATLLSVSFGTLAAIGLSQSHVPFRGAIMTILISPMIVPLIIPGVISGGLFAFVTSFDEVVAVLFLGSVETKALPWQMFTGLREQISPTILAVATILVTLSILLLTSVELLRRRSERIRGLSPE